MKTVLVTGGAGFIGSHLAEQLALQGHHVVILDDYCDYYDPTIKRANVEAIKSAGNITAVEGSITNAEVVDGLFVQYPFNAVYHLAAQAGVRASIENPRRYFEVNVLGTLNILESIRKYGNRPLIAASTSSVYGDNKELPFQEDAEVTSQLSPYAVSKRSTELICKNYMRLFGMDIWCMRLFTVYGPRQRPDMAISKFLTAVRDEKTITVYGDGSMKREYTYVTDVARSMVNALDRVKGFEIINVGGAETYTINQLLDMIQKVTAKTANLEHTEVPKGDVPATHADIVKAERLLGFHPVVGLEEGITKQWEWMHGVHPLADESGVNS